MTKKIIGLATIAVVASSPVMASVAQAPEIDAGAGVAALATLGAAIALAWERFRN